MTNKNSKITFACRAMMKNRFMLAPLTNQQSHDDGQLSNDELKWLTMRAEGGFGLVMTCASHVQEVGKGFAGQLGIFSDHLIDGHIKLTNNIKEQGSLAVIQLHHAGMRSPAELIHEKPVCPSDNEKTNACGLTLEEVVQLRDDFINAAIRAKKCSQVNRSRLLFEIVDGIREKCGKDFLLGVRLSPERFGMDIEEVRSVCQRLINGGNIDFLDISLWDSFKIPNEEKYQNSTLLEHFSNLDFKKVKWTVAGKISDAVDVQKILDAGVDFVSIGTSAILHHNFPKLVIEDPGFSPIAIPVSEAHLKKEGLGEKFVMYLKRWPDFVK